MLPQSKAPALTEHTISVSGLSLQYDELADQ
jgi:hypothetical protein